MSKLIYHILMGSQLVIKFLTFVASTLLCAASLAAPTIQVPPEKMKNNSEKPEQNSDLYNLDVISKPDVGPPVFLHTKETLVLPSRVVRDESLSLAIEASSNNQLMISAGWQFMNDNETANQFFAQLSGNSHFGLEYEKRSYLYPGNYQEPFWSYGIRFLEPTSDSLAGILKIENYFLTASAGFENVFRFDRRLTLRGQVAVGTQEAKASVSFGYTF